MGGGRTPPPRATPMRHWHPVESMPLTPRERVMRRWIIAIAALAGVLVIAVMAVLLYWFRFVLPTDPDPFTRGPWVAAVSPTSARIAWEIPDAEAVQIRAVSSDGRTITAQDGLLRGLAPGTRYGWTASTGEGARAFGSVTTPPVTAGSAVRFIITGDYGVGGEDQYAVARSGAAQGPAAEVASAGVRCHLPTA